MENEGILATIGGKSVLVRRDVEVIKLVLSVPSTIGCRVATRLFIHGAPRPRLSESIAV